MAVATAAPAATPLSQKTHDSVGAADLEKVTDYAPEKEISGDVGKVESKVILNKYHRVCLYRPCHLSKNENQKKRIKKLKSARNFIYQQNSLNSCNCRDQELAKIKIRKEDVELIVSHSMHCNFCTCCYRSESLRYQKLQQREV